MRKRMEYIAGTIGLMAGLGAVLPGTAAAQDRPMFELPPLRVEVLRTPDHGRAEALYDQPERWSEAAALHEAAARALPTNDVGQFFGFRRAAIVYASAGEPDRARRAMEKAADVAEATGDILVAAHVWVDAAFLAVDEGYPGKRREYIRNAERLAASELLTDAQRRDILARIVGPSLASAEGLASRNAFPVTSGAGQDG